MFGDAILMSIEEGGMDLQCHSVLTAFVALGWLTPFTD